jgi:hypothetical protein
LEEENENPRSQQERYGCNCRVCDGFVISRSAAAIAVFFETNCL